MSSDQEERQFNKTQSLSTAIGAFYKGPRCSVKIRLAIACSPPPSELKSGGENELHQQRKVD